MSGMFFWDTLYMLSPAISRRRHFVVRQSVRPSVRAWSYTKQYVNTMLGIHQIYNLEAVGDKDELIRFWDQKVEGEGYDEMKYDQKSLVKNASFWRRRTSLWLKTILFLATKVFFFLSYFYSLLLVVCIYLRWVQFELISFSGRLRTFNLWRNKFLSGVRMWRDATNWELGLWQTVYNMVHSARHCHLCVPTTWLMMELTQSSVPFVAVDCSTTVQTESRYCTTASR